ncbi:MAG: hypothetical protein K2X99_01060 [Gemmatimonadaceae bacterium]|nr:hypothetical protein [Gemmatimonadaceae bacterium]
MSRGAATDAERRLLTRVAIGAAIASVAAALATVVERGAGEGSLPPTVLAILSLGSPLSPPLVAIAAFAASRGARSLAGRRFWRRTTRAFLMFVVSWAAGWVGGRDASDSWRVVAADAAGLAYYPLAMLALLGIQHDLRGAAKWRALTDGLLVSLSFAASAWILLAAEKASAHFHVLSSYYDVLLPLAIAPTVYAGATLVIVRPRPVLSMGTWIGAIAITFAALEGPLEGLFDAIGSVGMWQLVTVTTAWAAVLELIGWREAGAPNGADASPRRGYSILPLFTIGVATIAVAYFTFIHGAKDEELRFVVGVSVVITLLLITRQLLAQEETLAAAAQSARLADRLSASERLEGLGRLAGGIAHDFNNVLQVVISTADAAASEPGTPELAKRDLEEIRQHATFGAGLARKLLMFARGSQTPAQTMDIGKQVELAIPLVRRLVDAVELSVDLPPTPLAVHGDPTTVEQVLVNLVANARDATGPAGRIRIALTEEIGRPHIPLRPDESVVGEVRDLRYAVLSVTDSGPGIASDVRERIFEPFFTTKGKQSGTGLGLATVFGLAKSGGGFVRLKSAPGQGATFAVALPLTDGSR